MSSVSGLPAKIRLWIASCQRAFFKENPEGDWLIYRRNYLELRCAVESVDSLGNPVEKLSVKLRGRSPSHCAKMAVKAREGTIKPRSKSSAPKEGATPKRRETQVEPSPHKTFDPDEDGEGEDIDMDWDGSSFAGSHHASGSTSEIGSFARVAAPGYSLPAPIRQPEFYTTRHDSTHYDKLMHIFTQHRSATPPSATETEPRALIDSAAETAQDLQIDRSASGDQKEREPWSPFAFSAKYGLIPPPISTGSEVALKDPSSGSSGSGSERLLSAASMFLQSSASLFIDWSGGAGASATGSAPSDRAKTEGRSTSL